MSNDPILRLQLDTDLGGLAVLEEAVNKILAPVTDLQDAEAVRYNVWLAVHELCVNIIGHAYEGEPGMIEVTFSLENDGRTLVVRTHDYGPHTFIFEDWSPPDLSEAPIHGLGIFLIRQLMDTLDYQTGADGSHWRLTKQLDRAADTAAAASVGVAP